MDRRTKTLGGAIGATLLTIAALSTSSCEDTGNGDMDGGLGIPGLNTLAEQCGLTCPASGRGVAYGNASITGYAAIDGFFRSVVNYDSVAAGVSAEIDAELAGIQSLFGISDAELQGRTLGAAIEAKLQTTYQASVVVNAQPAKCSVDARVAAEVTAKCQAEARCDAVEPGRATFECMGTCTVEADVMGRCQAGATVRCNVSGPQVACQGECSGTCSVELAAAASCSGNCVGSCDAACAGDTDTGAGCNGQCMGMCMGRCELSGMAAATCQGSCNGSCEYTPPSGSCEANAEVSCDLSATAKAQCNGRCDGEFVPPKANCNASASCEASAKAEAKFQVQCTPPSVEVKVISQGGAMAQAQVDFLIGQLKLRLPRLSAAAARAELASDAASELIASGSTAVEATGRALGSGEVDLIVSAKIVRCVPAQLTESQTVVNTASAELKKRTDSATSVANAFDMVM